MRECVNRQAGRGEIPDRLFQRGIQMTDDEIRKQNRETLLSRIAAWGKYDDYEQPIGLLDEAAEEIKRLRAELAAAH